MSHEILVINCGSSSIKFAVINPKNEATEISGLAERLASAEARIITKHQGKKTTTPLANADHKAALSAVFDLLETQGILGKVVAVGHRVVHGGEYFSESVTLDDKRLAQLKEISHLAPLHNPVNIIGIEASIQRLPKLPQVAVFDTAFHQTMPQEAFLYAVPLEYYRKYGVRRYGFHGTSYRYITRKAAELIGKAPGECGFLAAHLGNGCSAAAIRDGKSVDTSMGLTPLEGLMMGTRSGDVDPSLHQYLASHLDLTLDQVTETLNKSSGLLGLSTLSNDMRTLEEAMLAGDTKATLAIDTFCFKTARYLCSLAASLSHIDALIFTGGIGENGPIIREKILSHMGILGFEVDFELNQQQGDKLGRITTKSSTLALRVNTDEELMIAQDALAFVTV
jgi:acetate kinase